jgi:hypothetical protein
MNDSLQAAIKEAFVISPTGKVVLHTLEFRQTGVQDSVFIVQARRGINAFLEDGNEQFFLPIGFQFSLPPSTEEGVQSLTISVDNIDRTASDFVDTARNSRVPVTVLYRPYMSDDLSAPQMIPPLTLFLKDVQITGHQVVGRATFMDIVNRKFPSELYVRSRFPTLG